jgi:endonuclease YncB( thermonuclease family)
VLRFPHYRAFPRKVSGRKKATPGQSSGGRWRLAALPLRVLLDGRTYRRVASNPNSRAPSATGPWEPQPPLAGSVADLTKYLAHYRQRRRLRFLIALVATCLVGFAAPFAVTFILDRLSTPEGSEPAVMPIPQSTSTISILDRLNTPKRAEPAEKPIPQSASTISICTGWARARATCLVDGDTGWENGVKWRLSDVDTPEISKPGCPGELQQGLAARDRLQRAMSAGYTIAWLGRTDRYGRQLVDIRLQDGWDAGQLLLSEGLARSWPNGKKVWCNR